MVRRGKLYPKVYGLIRKLSTFLLKILLFPLYWFNRKNKRFKHKKSYHAPIQLNVFFVEAREKRRSYRHYVSDGWIKNLIEDIEHYYKNFELPRDEKKE